ncbi:MAG TPA: hypothetical protein DCS49_04440 [Gammaproteobacteria bacterium]|nr:hypothetical protein [Gammaproteobacteria bacterium]
MEQKATVISQQESTVVLAVDTASTCQQCALKKGCGAGLLSDIHPTRKKTISVQYPAQLQPGQLVTIVGETKTILGQASLVYLLPIVLVVLVAVICRELGGSELMQSIFGLLTLCLSLIGIRYYNQQQRSGFKISVIEDKVCTGY